jgi:hypothetical protein
MAAYYETMGNTIFLTPEAEMTMATDALLPSQFRDLRVTRLTPGEKRLLIFVLKQAMDDYAAPLLNGYKPKPERIRREVRAWVESKDRSSICCFIPLCEALDLEPSSVREKLRRQMDRVDAGRRLESGWNFNEIISPNVGLRKVAA